MSEEDFACDKFAPQKWRADTCRHCFQPQRLHTKKQAKQGTGGSSSAPNATSTKSLSSSVGSSPKITGGGLVVKQVSQRGGSPTTHKLKEEQNAVVWKSKSESPASSPAPSSTPSVKSPSPSAASPSNQTVFSKNNDKDSDLSKTVGISPQPQPALSVTSKTNTTSKTSSALKSLSMSRTVPSKPPPPVTASVGKRSSLPRTLPAASVKPSDVRLASPKTPEASSPCQSEGSSAGTASSWGKKQLTPERNDFEGATSSSVAEQLQDPSIVQPEIEVSKREIDNIETSGQTENTDSTAPLEGSPVNNTESIENAEKPGASAVIPGDNEEGDNKSNTFIGNGLADTAVAIPPAEEQPCENICEKEMIGIDHGQDTGITGSTEVASETVESVTEAISDGDQKNRQETENDESSRANMEVAKMPLLGVSEPDVVVDDTVPEQESPPADQAEADNEDVPAPMLTEGTPSVPEAPIDEEPMVQQVENVTSQNEFMANGESGELTDDPAQDMSVAPPSLSEDKPGLPEEDHMIPPLHTSSDQEVTIQATEDLLPPVTRASDEDLPAQESESVSTIPSLEAQEPRTEDQVEDPPPPAVSEEPSKQPPEDIVLPPPDDTPLIEGQVPCDDIIPPPVLPADAAGPDTSDMLELQAEEASLQPPPPQLSSPSDNVITAEPVVTPPPPPPLPSPPPDGDLECSAEHIPVPIPPPVSFSGASPPPPPPPPPIQPPKPMWNASLKAKSKSAAKVSTQASPPSPPSPRDQNAVSSAHAAAMSLIRDGGVSLRKVTLPAVRPVGEEKVVDLASEMRQKLRKRNKEEANSVKSQVEEKREEVKKVVEMLRGACSTRSYVHQLQGLAEKMDEMLQRVGFSEEVLHKYLQWPIHLAVALRNMLELMRQLEERVVNLERLSEQLVSCNRPGAMEEVTPSVGIVSPMQMDTDIVDRAITGMLAAAGKVRDVSQLGNSFPVFEHDLERPLHRANQAILPMMDLMYQKAFNTYDSIFQPSVTKFDKKFRVQNAIRLLKTCGLLSNGLCAQLNIPKHQDYSRAQLKKRELVEKGIGQEDEVDGEESVQLVKSGCTVAKRPGAVSGEGLCEKVVAGLSEGGSLSEELKEALTPETFSKMEKTFVKTVLTKGDDKLVEAALALTREVYSTNEVACHRCDFDWLYEFVMKSKHEQIRHLVTVCGVKVNAKGADIGNSVLHRAVARKDLATVAVLIRLGADPLQVNGRQHTPVQQLSVKCFPPVSIAANTTEKEPLFSLSSYINNPSLSDVVLISEDGKRFHGHRLVLCAQSPVFKTRLESDVWAESKNKEMAMPTISGRVLELLLNYLYTGRCLFPRDDLNLGLDLLAAADQYLLLELKQLCQQLLGEKIDAEVVIPMYYAAFRYGCTHLLANCANFLCSHYRDVQDPDHEALLHLLDNTPPQSL